ncbi:hypothetical protein ACIQAL_09355 [Pseudomonas sp. NPDC088368]|uniref:hypothetical protein n=1 Tax=Pseudomonas sp. NPDC088368 TaxID=3364453 RepID=UPI0038247521
MRLLKLMPHGRRLTHGESRQVVKFTKSFNTVSAVLVGGALLAACGQKESNTPETSKVVTGKTVNAQGMTEEGMKAKKELEDANTPLRVNFSAPALSEDASYINIQSKLSAIQIYTAKRNWEEGSDEIAKSVAGSILVKSDLPELYEYEAELTASQEAFKKRELMDKIASLVKNEAQKINGNIRVKLIVNADLKSYDFDSHSFTSNSCLFSEKLDYTKTEMSNPNSYAKAQKPRCYLQPSTTNFRVGIINGSKLNLKIDAEEIAKKIETARSSARFEIYGYVSSVERERLGGQPTDARYIMIDPQKINVIENGSVLYSKTF